ncbi:uncharacterized protein LOC131245363 [Magnolia sinica]|uniref:uncharacterized protein LOC131245363 n=1 Tax=Magnolia sinica TaxID=86752 RepID=UPI002659F44A|nr:uncharacterized protein LOC131245363 [Magnolia sinica]
MPFHHMISVLNSQFSCFPNSLSGPFFTSMMQSNSQIFLLRNISRAFTVTHSFPKVQFAGTLQLSISAEDSYETGQVLQSQLSMGSLLERTNDKEISIEKNQEYLFHDLNGSLHNKADSDSDGATIIAEKDYKEMQRRRKIGLANKGKTPWNKGRKHSAETRACIKQRTLEALRDPKVRRKMSECSRAHSVQSKARIGFALRRIWGERLKLKRLQEKCYLEWAKSIAEEAKKGGLDQQELDWDSYEKMKAEILCQQLQWAADKAKAKEIAKVRAQRAAKAKSEKKARLARERKEREQKANAREFKKKAEKKSEEEKEDLAIFKALKLKAKLTKIDHKSMVDLIASRGEMSNGLGPAIKEWDLDFIKREKMRREVSLADQIRAVKTKPATKEAPKTSSSDSLVEANAGKTIT